MGNISAQELLKKYRSGDCTEEEKASVESWYLQMDPVSEALPANELELALSRVSGKLPVAGRQPKQRSLWPKIAAAASILLLLSAGIYFILRRSKPADDAAQNIAYKNILPGGNNAILTLANGKRVILTGARNGKLATESDAVINKTADGRIAYAANSSGGGEEIAYNTMTTPNGGQYTLVLSDGTAVILNAASSITYPTKFSGTERKVELTGEAYFEVTHNKAMPFHVVTKTEDVEVLGTHFNINSYDNEPAVKTTLLEGSVKVTAGGHQQIIKPGEQAVLANNRIAVKQVDVEESVAWKNGYFLFKDASIESVMRQLARWYNIDVIYKGPIPQDSFQGEVSKFRNMGQVINVLQETKGVHFKSEGRTIIVSK